jgi:hypothetical protein
MDMATTTQQETTTMGHDFHGMNCELMGIFHSLNYDLENLDTAEIVEMLETMKAIFAAADAAGCVRKYSGNHEANLFLYPRMVGDQTTWIDPSDANGFDGVEISIEDVEKQRAKNAAARTDDDTVYFERILERFGVSVDEVAS